MFETGCIEVFYHNLMLIRCGVVVYRMKFSLPGPFAKQRLLLNGEGI